MKAKRLKILNESKMKQNASIIENDENNSYMGYPLWRQNKYKDHKEIMRQILSNNIGAFENFNSL